MILDSTMMVYDISAAAYVPKWLHFGDRYVYAHLIRQ